MKRPLQVGITGGIGSGKSVVCQIFQCLNVPVYDADRRAKELMATDPVLVKQIKKEFGERAYSSAGHLDRTYVAQMVFGHSEKLEKLNRLVHPRVGEDYIRWLNEQEDAAYVIREAALIFEAGSWQGLDKVIVVSAPESLRLKRVLSRDPHRTEKDIQDIFRSQLPEEEKRRRADMVIVNDDTQLVIPQVLALHQRFAKRP